MPTAATTMMLISGDTSLVQSCQGVVDSFPHLRLIAVGKTREADPYLLRDELALVLVHLVQKSDATEVIRLLRQTTFLKRSVAVLIVSEHHDAEQAWSLTRLGAVDYLSRPLDLDRLAYLINTLTVQVCDGHRRSASAGPELAGATDLRTASVEMASAGMEGLLEQVRVVAPQEATVLLEGETGTGKTRLARLIHALSPRRREPCRAVHCAALAAGLIDSELFGHVRGAFTGAERDRAGKFADAGRGTLLLDDVDALPPALQAKLLRAVEERAFEPVGSDKPVAVRARLLAASNRPLEGEVRAGRFRADLFYRLNVVTLHLPPLRERLGAVARLADGFIAEFAARNGRPVRGLSAPALRALEAYRWPGNVRELRNLIERAVALCPGPEIRAADLPDALAVAGPPGLGAAGQLASSASVLALRHARGQAEATRIAEALYRHGNNRLRAALELGISRRTLYKKLHRYGLMETGIAPAGLGVAVEA